MGRAVLAVVAGALAAGLTVGAVELLGARLLPGPTGIFGMVLAGWLLGAGTGAWVAVRLSGLVGLWPGLVVGGFILCAAAYTILSFTHPTWMAIAGLIGIPAAAWLAANAALSGRTASAR